MGVKSEKISLNFTPEQKERLEESAKAHNMSLASFIRYCTITYIELEERYKREKSKNE